MHGAFNCGYVVLVLSWLPENCDSLVHVGI